MAAKNGGNGGPPGGNGEPVSGMAVFAAELKAQRVKREWTQLELADKIGYSDSYLSEIERGVKVPAPEFAGKCDEVFDQPGTFMRLLEIAKLTIYPDYFALVIPYEEKAIRISGAENANVPGLLQTEEYARELIRVTRHAAGDDEVERLVAARMERQQILASGNPPCLWYVLDESLLRRVVGGAGVMAQQIERLIAVASAPGNFIQVVAFDKGGGIGAAGPITVYELRDTEPPVVAYLEANRGGLLVTDQQAVHQVLYDLNVIRASALSPRDTLNLLKEVQGSYEQQRMA